MIIKLSKDQKESLEIIRKDIEKQEFSPKNYLHLANVYEKITEQVGQKKILDLSCITCIATAVKICYNYITFHEGNVSSKPEPTQPEYVNPNETTLKTLAEIRAEYKALTGKKAHHKMKGEKIYNEIKKLKNEE